MRFLKTVAIFFVSFLTYPIGYNLRPFAKAGILHFRQALSAKEIKPDRILGVVDTVFKFMLHF